MATSRPAADRSLDRIITAVGLAIAAAFLVGAVLAGLAGRTPSWVSIHLALAGGATVAIASVLPFLMAGVLIVPSSRPAARIAAITLLGTGQLVAVAGMSLGHTALSALGGTAFLAGLAVLLLIIVGLVRGTAGPRRAFALIGGAALLNVGAGVSLAVLFLAGALPADTWAFARPAHVWLNVFGFLLVVIAAAMAHLYPMTIAARIGGQRVSSAALTVLAIAPALVALGELVRSDVVVRGGAALMLSGAALFAAVMFQAHRRRQSWSTDAGWHAFAGRSMEAGMAWLMVSVSGAAGRLLLEGAGPQGWRMTDVAAPLIIGGVVQVLTGSWTQLVPTMGPGAALEHARQRRILALGWRLRLVTLNAGVAGLVAAPALAPGALPLAMALAAGAILASVATLAAAMVVPAAIVVRARRSLQAAHPPRSSNGAPPVRSAP